MRLGRSGRENVDTISAAVAKVITAHILNNPTQPAHCPFCGSGAIVGRSDGIIECDFCKRGCVIMEQPLHTSMPGTPGAKPAATTPPPEVPQVDPAELAEAPPFDPGDTAEPEMPEQFATAKGALLDRKSYVRHLAFQHSPEVMRSRR